MASYITCRAGAGVGVADRLGTHISIHCDRVARSRSQASECEFVLISDPTRSRSV